MSAVVLSLSFLFGVVVRHIARASGQGFDCRAGQIGHSVANGLPPLQRFFGALPFSGRTQRGQIFDFFLMHKFDV